MTFFDNFHAHDKHLKRWFLSRQRVLPWRENRTPYRVWVSEIMLQQTQVATVIDYYERFTTRFPTVHDLAKAPEDDVLALWSGLGYYSRARNLHKTAQIIVADHAGVFPEDHRELQKLPGIGSYTAGAILAFAFGKASPVVDGNISRVLARLLNDDTLWGDAAGKKHFEALSLKLAEKASSVLLWQEGLMELGALVCKPQQPNCDTCPFNQVCLAKKESRIESLPVLMKKAEKTRLDVFCELIHDEKHIWLEKNHTNPLFKGLYAPPVCLPFQDGISVSRTLTHRNLHLHGKLVPMSSQKHPSPHWVKRDELNQIGLSAAVKALLSKAALLSLVMILGCSHKNPSIRYIMREPTPVTLPERLSPFEYARSLIGQSHAVLNDQNYRSDCSGTAKAIYDAAGWSLGGAQGTEEIYRYIQKKGKLVTTRDPKAGDLVFFNAPDKKKLAHIGFVEEILPDGTVLFIHHMSGVIIRSRMNLKTPTLQVDPQSQVRLNHILRRDKKKGYTAGQLFVAFGRLS